MEVNWWRFDWWRFTQGGGALSAWLPHPPLLLLAEQPADGRLDALLLGLLVVQRVLAAGHAAQGAGLGLQRGRHPGGSNEHAVSIGVHVGCTSGTCLKPNIL